MSMEQLHFVPGTSTHTHTPSWYFWHSHQQLLTIGPCPILFKGQFLICSQHLHAWKRSYLSVSNSQMQWRALWSASWNGPQQLTTPSMCIWSKATTACTKGESVNEWSVQEDSRRMHSETLPTLPGRATLWESVGTALRFVPAKNLHRSMSTAWSCENSSAVNFRKFTMSCGVWQTRNDNDIKARDKFWGNVKVV